MKIFLCHFSFFLDTQKGILEGEYFVIFEVKINPKYIKGKFFYINI